MTKRRTVLHLLMCGAAACLAPLNAAELPAPPSGLSVPPKPIEMPAFELPVLDGSSLRSESLRGQVVLVRYWASW